MLSSSWGSMSQRGQNSSLLGEVSMKARTLLPAAILAWLVVAVAAQQPGAAQLLTNEEVNEFLSEAFWLEGEKCPVQRRNAVGARTEDGNLVLVALVDTSAFSSEFQGKYVGVVVIGKGNVMLGESAIKPGTYGLGKKKGTAEDEETVTFVIYDVFGTALAEVAARKDEALRPVTPIQLKAEAEGPLRLYLGAYYVLLSWK